MQSISISNAGEIGKGGLLPCQLFPFPSSHMYCMPVFAYQGAESQDTASSEMRIRLDVTVWHRWEWKWNGCEEERQMRCDVELLNR